MKLYLLAAGLISFAVGPALAATPQAFEFKGVKTGDAIDTSRLGKCKRLKDGITECIPKDRVIGGVEKRGEPRMGFNNDRLVYVSHTFSKKSFSKLKAMCEDAYGKPFESVRGNDWKKNEIHKWEFATGILTLTLYENEDEGLFEYRDDYQPPVSEIRNDFKN